MPTLFCIVEVRPDGQEWLVSRLGDHEGAAPSPEDGYDRNTSASYWGTEGAANSDLSYWYGPGSYVNRRGTGRTFKVVPLPNTAWRVRERHRLANTEGPALPWHTQGWWTGSPHCANHYAHYSQKDPNLIAFTESPEKGRQDRQTAMKPGRYLTKYFSDVLTPEEIALWSNKFLAASGPGVLKFAATPDEIEEVYTTGPSSCMSYGAHEFSSPEHPTRIYGAGDLAVSYVQRGSDITARALCWPERKVYGRVYGDAVRLKNLLHGAGYTEGFNSCFDGARLLRIPYDDCDGVFVAPYIDWQPYVSDDGAHLIISSGGEICCQGTEGYSRGLNHRCGCCERGMDDGTWVDCEEEYICDACLDAHYFYCDRYHEHFPNEEHVDMYNGQDWCQSAFEAYGVECAATGRNLCHYDAVELHDGTFWCSEYFAENGFICEESADYYPLSEMAHDKDGNPTGISKDHYMPDEDDDGDEDSPVDDNTYAPAAQAA